MFCTWTLDGSESTASNPGSFTPDRKPSLSNWMGPRAGMDVVDLGATSAVADRRFHGRVVWFLH